MVRNLLVQVCGIVANCYQYVFFGFYIKLFTERWLEHPILKKKKNFILKISYMGNVKTTTNLQVDTTNLQVDKSNFKV